MIPWVLLDTATVPGDGGELRLMRRGDEYAIMVGPIALMNSRLSGSEEALATLVAARLADRPAPCILIGGLGMGFTLRAALAVLPEKAQVVVSELVPAVADWARGPMSPLFGDSLADRRVQILVGDVADHIAAGQGAYDAILLDVDNGPEGLTRQGNDGLYQVAGLARSRAALRSGGVLAVWSSHPSPRFTQRLRAAGFQAEEVPTAARRTGRGGRHMIWLATRQGA